MILSNNIQIDLQATDPMGEEYQSFIEGMSIEDKLGFDMDSFMNLPLDERLEHAYKTGVSTEELMDAGLLGDMPVDTIPGMDYDGGVEDMARDFDYLRGHGDIFSNGTPEQLNAIYEAANDLGMSMDDYYNLIMQGDKQYIDYMQQMDWSQNQPYSQYDYYAYGQPGYYDMGND